MAATDYDFRLSRNEIIARAFELVGAKSRGESLPGEMLAEGVSALNTLVKSWQGKNVFLWSVKVVEQLLTATNESYALSSDPPIISIDSAYIVNASNDDRQLEVISWREYQSIPDKESAGEPNAVALDGQSAPTLYVHPVPAQGYTLKLVAISKLKDWDSPGSGGDFPARWERALIYNLASDLADGYGLPLGERDRLIGKADRLFIEARQGDGEDVTGSFVSGSYRVRRR